MIRMLSQNEIEPLKKQVENDISGSIFNFGEVRSYPQSSLASADTVLTLLMRPALQATPSWSIPK